jgi:small subunit ribosomal protein S1
MVEGTITRITPFGAFVQVSNVIEALVHISELSQAHVSDPNTLVKIGEKKQFKIIGIDKDQHKLSLSLKDDATKDSKTDKVASDEPAKKPAKKAKE